MSSEFDIFVQLREQDALCYIDDSEVYVQLSTGKPTCALMPLVGKIKQLTDLELAATDVDDEGLSHIGGLNKLRSIDVSTTQVTGKGLRVVASLPALEKFIGIIRDHADEGVRFLSASKKLRIVELSCSRISNDSFNALATLPELESLDVSQSSVSGNLAPLVQCRKLKHFSGSDTLFDDDGVKVLGQLDSLEYLNLSGTRITDASCAEIAKLTNLKSLLIASLPGITERGLAELVTLKDLGYLTVEDIPLDERALVHLEQLTDLKNLRISKGDIGVNQRKRFDSKLPECNVDWQD